MKRIVPFLVGSAVAVSLAAAAFAQSSTPAGSDPSAAPAASSPAPATPPPDASAVPATAPASTAEAAKAPASNPAIDRVKERGMKISAKQKAEVDKKIDDIEKAIETESTTKGDAEVAGRVAAEFGVTPDALIAERSKYGRGWGELVVGRTLAANAKTDATLDDLFTMRSQGVGWASIAAGLDLKLADVVTAVKSEQQVAMGVEKGDGKPAMIAMAAAPKTKADSKVKASASDAGVGGGVDLNKATGK
ncbi:MAG TPA: hypothetical protein VN539_06665 [Candidatus Saccharimonadales bacterium]|nr:hypothetical protein [Candidatus Saccharimonadales bacterium]